MGEAASGATESDVAIVGGGPAGLAAGLTLLKRPGTRVTLIDAAGFDAPRIGESLSPGVRELLRYLGVWAAVQGSQSLDLFANRAAWGSAEPTALDFMMTVHGSGWALDRLAFDRMLAEAFVARGGRLIAPARCREIGRVPGRGWHLRLRTSEGERDLYGRYLIDASGRSGTVARRTGAERRAADALVGVCRTGRCAGPIEQSLLVETVPDGWWYTAPLPQGRIAAVFMSDADLVSRAGAAKTSGWTRRLDAAPLTRDRLAGVRFDGDVRTHLAGSSILDPMGGADWVAVGDAAAARDPLSASGIPHALGTGAHGARVAADALYGTGALLPHYRQALTADYQVYLDTRARIYAAERRWPQAPFWHRRQGQRLAA